MIITFIYDAISFIWRRNGDSAFSIIAHASTRMNPKELRDAGDFLKALAENREATKGGE